MFEAKFQEAKIFKNIVDAIKELVKNVNLDMNSGGISLQAMDSSHVALVSLQLNEGGFQKYRCDRNLTMGLSIENLSKILKCAGSDDILTLKTQEEEPSTLQFTFEQKKGERVSEFQLNLISLDSEQLGIPDQEYSSLITMPSADFTKICKELSSINESITISTSKDSVRFSVQGEIGGGTINIKSNDTEKKEDQVICDVQVPVTLNFAVRYVSNIQYKNNLTLRYLNLFNKASSLSSQVHLSLQADSPLIVDFQIENLGSLKFYLAPKITDEDEK